MPKLMTRQVREDRELGYITNYSSKTRNWSFYSSFFPLANLETESIEELSIIKDPDPIEKLRNRLDQESSDYSEDIRTWIR